MQLPAFLSEWVTSVFPMLKETHQLVGELKAANDKRSDLTAEVERLTLLNQAADERIKALEADIAEANTKWATINEALEAEKAAHAKTTEAHEALKANPSRQAAEILARVGVNQANAPAMEARTNPAEAPKPELKGLDRIRAATKEQLGRNGHAKN